MKCGNRPAAFAGRSFLPPFAGLATGIPAMPYTGEYPIPLATYPPIKYRRAAGVILRNSPEKILRTSGEKIVTHYTISLLLTGVSCFQCLRCVRLQRGRTFRGEFVYTAKRCCRSVAPRTKTKRDQRRSVYPGKLTDSRLR